MRRIYLLSPASCAGKRARILLRETAAFDLACRLRTRGGVELGEAFSFLSGLYFRGKLAYATAFADPPAPLPGVLVITPRDGLRPPRERVTASVLRRWASVPVDASEPRYRRPLERDLCAVESAAGPDCLFVLLGSIATGKYIDVLGAILGSRLRFPAEFVGRGDMSRGGLLLRRVDEGRPLEYVALDGAVRRGPRPPRLERLRKHGRGRAEKLR